MRIYFDNNATTAVDERVLAALSSSLRDVYGNASSVHKEGQAARRAIEDARESVAQLIGATPREVVFTSGGTESNNAAIFGAAAGAIVTTAIEHPSVLEPIAELERRGARVHRVAPARSGEVPADAVIDAIGDDTKLVAVMLANNETGVIQPVEAIGRVCRERGIHFHVDAVQGAGKIDIDVETIECDTLALSAHKLHAPKGVGALFVRRGLAMSPYLFGGAQERRRRAGTENVPLAAAFGVAALLADDPEPRERVRALRDGFESRLVAVIPSEGTVGGHSGENDNPSSAGACPERSRRGTFSPHEGRRVSILDSRENFSSRALSPRQPYRRGERVVEDRVRGALAKHVIGSGMTINGATAARVPNTSNVTFHGADGEGIVIGLDLAGIAVSTGSACSSGRVEPSHVLLAMGLSPEEAKSTVRFSMSRFTTEEEVARVVAVLRDVVPRCVR